MRNLTLNEKITIKGILARYNTIQHIEFTSKAGRQVKLSYKYNKVQDNYLYWYSNGKCFTASKKKLDNLLNIIKYM